MIVDLSFWQEYGPRVVTALVVLAIGGFLAVVGRGAARAYEHAMVERAKQYRSTPIRARRKLRASFEKSVSALAEKSRRARQLQGIALAVTIAIPTALAARTGLDFVDCPDWARWTGTVVALSVVMGMLALWWLRSSRDRAQRLLTETRLEKEPAPE